jgi:hypothetical protein
MTDDTSATNNNDFSLEYLIEKIRSNRLNKNKRMKSNKNVSIKISVNNSSVVNMMDDLNAIKEKKRIVSFSNAIAGLFQKRRNKYINVTRSAKTIHHDTSNDIVKSAKKHPSDFIVQDSLDKSKTLTYENEFTGCKRPRIIQDSLAKRLTIKTNYNFIKKSRGFKNRNKMIMMSNMANNGPIQNFTNTFNTPSLDFHHRINYPMYASTSNNGFYHYVDYVPQSSWFYIP